MSIFYSCLFKKVPIDGVQTYDELLNCFWILLLVFGSALLQSQKSPNHSVSIIKIHPPQTILAKTSLFLLLKVFDWFFKHSFRSFSLQFGKFALLHLQHHENLLLICLSSFVLRECFEYQEIYQEIHWDYKRTVYFFYRFSWKKKTLQKMIQTILCFSFFEWLIFLKLNKIFELNLQFL